MCFCVGSYIHTVVGYIGYILPAALVSRWAPTNTTSSSATQMARPQPVGCSESQLGDRNSMGQGTVVSLRSKPTWEQRFLAFAKAMTTHGGRLAAEEYLIGVE